MEEELDVQPVRDDPPEPHNPRVRRNTIDHDVDWCKKFGYGVGHFYNDLCASMWFTYLMIFLEKVLKFRSSHAGLLMLIGQATDAISTPLVGIWSDSNVLPAFLDKIGRRMSWHIIGTICVTLSFPFIFNHCFICNDSGSEWYKVVWFVPFIMVFQFGWASVQISHLALIPELSSLDSSRTAMNSLRYAFTVIANLAVFVILAWLLSSDSGHGSAIGPWDFAQFRTAAFMVVAGGLVVTILFYTITREPQHQRRYSRLNSFSSDTSELTRMHWTSWFGHVQFYQVALLYMLARLYVNVSQVYFPFYITITEDFPKNYVAILPMVSYISSFLISLMKIVPAINNKINKKGLLFVGILVGLGTCAWMYFPLDTISIYTVSAFIGVSQAILLITSLSLTADLINKNTESGAFVYGAMSFLDKLANGIAYQIIEIFNPSCETKSHIACAYFYRNIIVFVPGVCLVLALIVLISLMPHSIGRRGRQRLEEDQETIMDDEEPVAVTA